MYTQKFLPFFIQGQNWSNLTREPPGSELESKPYRNEPENYINRAVIDVDLGN